MGLRLEKHLEKLREQYKAQKDEEETKRQFYHSPETARREGDDGEPLEESSSQSELTPEPSPLLNQREASESARDSSPATQPAARVPPQVAPRPSGGARQTGAMGQANGAHVSPPSPAYNPYPPPSQAPPSPKEERHPSPQEPAPLPPVTQHVAPPTAPPTNATPDKEALFAFAWYHGSIARDEALRRLEGVGGFDG